jgi:hypothetical protein
MGKEPYREPGRNMDIETTKLTIRLPLRYVTFAKDYAKTHGLTVTEVITRYLRRMEALERHTPSPELDAITGLVPPDIDVEEDYRRHLLDKHSDNSPMSLR